MNSSQWYTFDVCTGRVLTIEHLPYRGQIQNRLIDGDVMITTQEMFEKVGFKIVQTWYFKGKCHDDFERSG